MGVRLFFGDDGTCVREMKQPFASVERYEQRHHRMLSVLDEGECEAIALAGEVGADLLLIDDRQGRREAKRRNLRVIGTLGVLAEAAAKGLIDLPRVKAER